MARRSPIDILLTTRLAALAAAVPPARGGDVEAVHQARVASRRLREVIPVVADVARSARRADGAVRQVTRALGPVRELDVTSGLYAELTATMPMHPIADAAVERAFARQRSTATRAMRRALGAARWERISALLDTLAADVAGTRVTEVAAGVDARVGQRARRASKALDRVGSVYVPDRLHAVRIAVKQLRYALEIAGELRLKRTVTALRQLRSAQDLLGRAHDLHVLGVHVRQVEGELVLTSRPASRDLRRLTRRIDIECMALHASFLGRRAALLRRVSAMAPKPAALRSGTTE